MNLKFTYDVATAKTATTNRSHLFGCICVATLISLLNLSQAFAAPLAHDDGDVHDVNKFVGDGVSVSNNTILYVKNGASISRSVALDGLAVESVRSTVNMQGGEINGNVDYDKLNMTGGRINGDVSSFGGRSLSMSGGVIDGRVTVAGPNATFSGGRVGSIFSESVSHLDISGGTFGEISTLSGAYDISGGSFLDELEVIVAGDAQMDITGGKFTGGFRYGGVFGEGDQTAFTFYGDLMLSPVQAAGDPSDLIFKTIISGTLLDGSAIEQTITCNNFIGRAPCSGVVISAVDIRQGQFFAVEPSIAIFENSNTVTITIKRVSGSFGTVSVDFATVDGSATANIDYFPTSGTLLFADGDISKTFEVTLRDDTEFEGNENFFIALSNPQGGRVLANNESAQVIIRDDDPAPSPGAFQFGKASYSVSENGSSVSVAVQRVGGSSGEVSVGFSTADGSAIANVDYKPVSKVLTFADGVTSNIITVSLIDDTTYEGNEAFAVNLSNVQGGATLGGIPTAQVVIEENDPVPASGVIQFDNASYNPSENVNSVSVSVDRVNGSFGAVTVDYNTADITAVARQDYQSISGTLTFVDGETSKVINVSLLDDATYEGTETFALELSNAQGGATLGTVSSKQIAIAENDPAPPAGVLQFSGVSDDPKESDGSVIITVTRTNGEFGEVSVDYSTADLTATAGEDYQPAVGTLTFSAGEISSSRIIEIVLLNDADYEGDEAFTVVLSNVQGGAILGGISSKQIDIIEDDSPPSAGVIQFSGTSFSDEESAARVLVTVARKNFDPDSGEVSVDYSTVDLTATAGQDYQRTSGTLVFKDGEDNKTIGVPLIDDNIDEGEEVFTIVLSNAQGGAVLGSPKGASIKIIEDDVSVSAGTSDNGISSSGGGGAIHPLYLLSLIGYFLLFPGCRRKQL